MIALVKMTTPEGVEIEGVPFEPVNPQLVKRVADALSSHKAARDEAAAIWLRSTNSERLALLSCAGLSRLGEHRPFSNFGSGAQAKLVQAMRERGVL